jgi:diguanylate cyclase (GGDEF)-like protein
MSTALLQSSALSSATPLLSPGLGKNGADKNEEALMLALRVIAEQQRRINELESEVQTDPLTGLLNKRGFMKAMNRESERALRAGNASAILVMFDLDGLKQVNDTYGHLAGDAYIAGMAAELQNIVRGTDYVARLGGDEFALLMTDVDISKGWARIAAIVDQLNRRIVTFGAQRFVLQASHGSAVLMPEDKAEATIAEADARLYERKTERKGGRNGKTIAKEMMN